jgi:hypothetical protein
MSGNLAARFLGLFDGLRRAHGTYRIDDSSPSPKGKVEGRGLTVREEVTQDKWQAHLDGERSIGIVPINEEAQCRWGAIDIDDYDMDLVELEKQVRGQDLPVILCRTKSGGAHAYLFLADWAPASLVRKKLAEMAAALGYAQVEIFPKQEKLASREDVGNWINMPYFAGAETDRYAFVRGEALTPEAFLDLAENLRAKVTPQLLEEVTFTPVDEFYEGPPCLQTLTSEGGVPEGARNNTLFNIGVYLRERFGDDWRSQLDHYNRTFFDPPLDKGEVRQVAKQLDRKEYYYTCSREPLAGVCQKEVCLHRRFGVGHGGEQEDPFIIDEIQKVNTEPVQWLVTVQGCQLKVETNELMNLGKFYQLILEQLNFWPPPMKNERWRQMVNEKIANAVEVEAPEDAGPKGQFWFHLEQFCTTGPQGRSREEILRGKPYNEGGWTYFRSADLMRYLENQRFRELRQSDIWTLLKQSRQVVHHFWNIKGKGVNVWGIPAFEEQNEEYTVPAEDF